MQDHFLQGLWVSIDKVEYMGGQVMHPDRPHQFNYFITIHNDSDRNVTIVGRKWIITNALKQKTIVEADGVVGKFPKLRPGQCFDYNSCHLLDSDSDAEGSYLAKDDEGQAILTKIPPFKMNIPKAD